MDELICNKFFVNAAVDGLAALLELDGKRITTEVADEVFGFAVAELDFVDDKVLDFISLEARDLVPVVVEPVDLVLAVAEVVDLADVDLAPVARVVVLAVSAL